MPARSVVEPCASADRAGALASVPADAPSRQRDVRVGSDIAPPRRASADASCDVVAPRRASTDASFVAPPRRASTDASFVAPPRRTSVDRDASLVAAPHRAGAEGVATRADAVSLLGITSRLLRHRVALAACAIVLSLVACKHHFDPREAAHVEQHALAVGAKAPDAPLVSTSGTPVALADALHAQSRTIVVFYRGFF